MARCSIRPAHIDEASRLTHLCKEASIPYGYDEDTIRRFEPALAVDPALIASGLTFVAENGRAENGRSDPAGVMAVRPVGLGGIILLDRIFVAPASQRKGIGRRLFATAVEKSAGMGGSAILIYSHPQAAGFYQRVGCTRIGETPFYLSREIRMPMMVYSIPALSGGT
jgi:predicted N-acetyltransferase YhbS